MSDDMHHIVLLPGFFSFGNFGSVRYFDPEIGQTLQRAFEREGRKVNIVEVPSQPTASIRRRAARALGVVTQVARDHDGPIHLIGHSTGGLDARLAITPTAALPGAPKDEVYARIASLVTVSTPHFGTPLAHLFGSSMGGPLTRLVAALTLFVMRHGRLPLRAGIKLGGLWSRADDWLGLKNTVLDEAYRGFLGEFDDNAQQAVVNFAQAVRQDQSLIFQLTDSGCDLLNAATGEPSKVHYGSIVTCGAPPRPLSSAGSAHDIYAHFMHALYFLLYHGNRRASLKWLPEPSRAQAAMLQRDLERTIDARDNDGVVPCWSQIWGQVIAAAHADHLDIVGHYGAEAQGASTDWLPSHSGFSRQKFREVWGRCAEFLLTERDTARDDSEEMGTDRVRADGVNEKDRHRQSA